MSLKAAFGLACRVDMPQTPCYAADHDNGRCYAQVWKVEWNGRGDEKVIQKSLLSRLSICRVSFGWMLSMFPHLWIPPFSQFRLPLRRLCCFPNLQLYSLPRP